MTSSASGNSATSFVVGELVGGAGELRGADGLELGAQEDLTAGDQGERDEQQEGGMRMA